MKRSNICVVIKLLCTKQRLENQGYIFSAQERCARLVAPTAVVAASDDMGRVCADCAGGGE